MSTVHFTTSEKFETKIKKLAADHNLDLWCNEEQKITITGTPTGGNFKLTLNGEQTANIAHNASATVVQAALEALTNVSAGDLSATGGAFPTTAVTIKFLVNLGKQDVLMMEIDTTGLTDGSSPAGDVEEMIKGFGDDVIALRRLEQAYDIIEAVLVPRGLTPTQISTWARGEEFQLDLATYWYAKDCGWGGKTIDEKDWTTVFNRLKELEIVSIIDTTGALLLRGKAVALAMDLIQINDNLGIER